MLLVNKFKKSYTRIGGGSNPSGPEVPEGLLKKCNMCKAAIYTDEVIAIIIFAQSVKDILN